MNLTSPRKHLRKAGLAIALAGLVSLFGMGTAQAQWIVNDPTTLAKQIEEYGKELERWQRTVSQYEQTLQHYQQQLINLPKLSLPMPQFNIAFSKRDQMDGVQENCPSPNSGGGIGGIIEGQLQNFIPGGQSIAQQQQTICSMMIQAQNAKYNATVDALTQIKTYQDQINKIEEQRDNTGTSEGNLAANNNEILRYIARIETTYQNYQTNMVAYDGYIDGLKIHQQGLAKQAMKGQNLLGTLVETATLKAALTIGTN